MTAAPLLLVMPGAEAFAGALIAHAPLDRADVAWRRFPDGESLVRIDAECGDRDIALLANLREPDAQALPLRFAADTARALGATRVGLVAPYLPYLRQDAAFQRGEARSAASFGAFLSECFDWLVCVDPHLHRLRGLDEVLRIPAVVASGCGAIAEYVGTRIEAPLLIGPDAESAQWVEAVARACGAPWLVLRKDRRGDRDVTVSAPDASRLRGRQPVLIDDIVSTGCTMLAALGRLRESGAAAPECLTVHGLFADASDRRLLEAGAASVRSSNTLPHERNHFDVAPAVARALARFLPMLQRT